MKIKITTDRMPWVNGEPQPLGAEIDAPDESAKSLIEAGFAEAVEAPKPAKKVAKE